MSTFITVAIGLLFLIAYFQQGSYSLYMLLSMITCFFTTFHNMFLALCSERIPRWTGVTAWSPNTYTSQNNQKAYQTSHPGARNNRTVLGTNPAPSSLMVLLSADNGMLYLFGIEGIDFMGARRSNSNNGNEFRPKLLTVLIGVVELPVKVSIQIYLLVLLL